MPKRKKPKTFAELQGHWYAKLRKDGFKDIECGVDLNQTAGQTLRQGGPNSHILWDFQRSERDGDGQGMLAADDSYVSPMADSAFDSVWNTSKHEYFDRISHFALNLPNQDSIMAKVLADLANGSGDSRKTVARRHRTSMDKLNTIWEATVSALGLPGSWRTMHSNGAVDEPVEPAPARSLSVKEIAGLEYRAPKQIKDRTE